MSPPLISMPPFPSATKELLFTPFLKPPLRITPQPPKYSKWHLSIRQSDPPQISIAFSIEFLRICFDVQWISLGFASMFNRISEDLLRCSMEFPWSCLHFQWISFGFACIFDGCPWLFVNSFKLFVEKDLRNIEIVLKIIAFFIGGGIERSGNQRGRCRDSEGAAPAAEPG